MKPFLLSLASLIFFVAHLVAQHPKVDWKNIPTDTKASFRGLSVVDDHVAWLGGSKGTVGFTNDGGQTWTFSVIPGYEAYDFRSVYAFDANHVVIANAGSPAYVLKTDDGGKNWKIAYQNDDKDAFIDGIGFWDDQKGIVYGDPMNSRMLLLTTADGGASWSAVPEDQRPLLKEGEASFAASGTGIRFFPKGKVIITTGGQTSRVWISEDGGQHWRFLAPPILQGGKMTGIYTAAYLNFKEGIVAGGDYDNHALTKDHILYTTDGGKTWTRPATPTRGLRECVEYITPKLLIATGKEGSDISFDGGKNWEALSDEKFFSVVRKARNGKAIIAAGGKGSVAVITMK